MCKWEWPFVFIETKTNKYPLITEARLFFLKKTKNTSKPFVIKMVHGSYLVYDLHTGQTLHARDIVFEKIRTESYSHM